MRLRALEQSALAQQRRSRGNNIMATPKQIEANRLNSLKSCGPKSPGTKAKVSQNRRTHGLCGKFNVLACESQQQYDELVAALIEAE